MSTAGKERRRNKRRRIRKSNIGENQKIQSRMCLLMLVMINFVNSVILTLEVCGEESFISFTMFVVNTIVVFLAMYGLYNFKPVFLSPNVVMKIVLSSSALFYGLQLAETAPSSCIFAWLTFSIVLFILEIHSMFSTTFDIIKQLNLRAYSKPPPSYNQVVALEAPPPTYNEALQLRLEQQNPNVQPTSAPEQEHPEPAAVHQQPVQLRTEDLSHFLV